MEKKIKKTLIDIANWVHDNVNVRIDDSNNMFDKTILAETYFAFDALLRNDFLLPHEQIILKRDFSKIFHMVYSEESLFYYSSFYYAYHNVKNKDVNEIQTVIHKLNLDIMTMHLCIKEIEDSKFDLGSSTDDYFFSRMERCSWAFNYILKNGMEEFYIGSLYCLVNLIQVLTLYYEIGKSKYRKDIDPLLNVLNKVLNEYLENMKIKQILIENNQLRFFLISQQMKLDKIIGTNYDIKISKIDFKTERTRSLLRILTSLYVINLDYFKTAFEENFNRLYSEYSHMQELDKILFLRSISNYIQLTSFISEPLELGLYEEILEYDTEKILEDVFSINKLNFSDVTEEDIEKLKSFKDDVLRQKVANSMQGIRKQLLDREARKPHGVSEISDMEVELSLNGDKIYLCMPFKSGIEIRGNSVPVDVSYQIIRPFLEFKRCVVIFITAKKCSENLTNYVKKLRNNLGWPVDVIEEKALAALLKLYKQL